MKKHTPKPGKVIEINGARIRDHLGDVMRGSVEETLNALLDAEADALRGARRYEHSPDRADIRAGFYDRKLHTKAGEVTLIEPYRHLRSEISASTEISAYRPTGSREDYSRRCESAALRRLGLRPRWAVRTFLVTTQGFHNLCQRHDLKQLVTTTRWCRVIPRFPPTPVN
jgi:hypothetical protein